MSSSDLNDEYWRSATPDVSTFTVRLRDGYGADSFRKLTCCIDSGELFFEGDIIVRRALIHSHLARPLSFFGIGVTSSASKWPNGIIPFASSAPLKPLVKQATDHWMDLTPLRFAPYQGQDDYLLFTSSLMNASSIGRQGGQQVVNLSAVASLGTAIHEIGHAVGLWHEHSRSDRDEFITIRWENVRDDARHQFNQPVQNAIDLNSYDFSSIMHYPAAAFTSNGLPTIQPKHGEVIGQRDGLSSGDVLAIQRLYSNPNP